MRYVTVKLRRSGARAAATFSAVIDLRSDTATKPSEGMRTAMANAEVSDEQKREDPTVLDLGLRDGRLRRQGGLVHVAAGSVRVLIWRRDLIDPCAELPA